MKMCLIALLFAVTAIVSGVERLTPEETQAHILAPRSGFICCVCSLSRVREIITGYVNGLNWH